MKKTLKRNEPQSLINYRLMYPNDDFKKGFRKNAGAEGNREVNKALITEQGGICIYCEIDLKDANGRAINDFRVEHFFPEKPQVKDQRNDNINYALHWPNLFGCCTGGNAPYVIDAERRYTNPEFCCDVDKANHDWTDQILDPLTEIPAFPPLFEFNEIGEMKVSDDTCPENIKQKSRQTIELLNLDTPKLQKFREEVIFNLKQQIFNEFDINIDINERMETLARSYLTQNDSGMLQPFFSTIRWFLGPVAEKVLHEINYNG
ncbi:TPA: retron Ec78 anti-phage system effector HNH endonuclease PtuB [Serratia fonticola]